jgi:hypothetical protein
METLSNILLLFEVALFALLMGNVGNLIINLLIKDDANN